MLSLKSKVGVRSDSYQDEVNQNRVLAFCEAVGIQNSDVVPPTFMTLFRKGEFELFQKLDLELSRVLHSEQEYQFENALKPGDKINYRTILNQVREKKNGLGGFQFLTFVTEVQAERECGSVPIGKATTSVLMRYLNEAQEGNL